MCHAGKCEKKLENFEIGKERECVLFYSKSCGWCKKMMPEWNKFKKDVSGELKVRKVEASEDPETINNLGIKGFPTIILFDNGEKKVHNGERTLTGLKNFVGL